MADRKPAKIVTLNVLQRFTVIIKYYLSQIDLK